MTFAIVMVRHQFQSIVFFVIDVVVVMFNMFTEMTAANVRIWKSCAKAL